MAFETLISARQLQSILAAGGEILLLDCEFELGAPQKGAAIYAKGHLPGARYAHLDDDLAGQPDGTNGRHPLPARVAFAAWLRSKGLRKGQQVVTYDSNGGAWAARAWWLLRWMGHREVAVLDGGKPAWVAAGLPLETGAPAPGITGDFETGEPLVATPVTVDEVLANIGASTMQVLDARDPARFAGEPNPLDPVTGHIPGAKNRFFRDNLGPDGLFREAADLAQDFEGLLAGKEAVLSCGSGVSACHNALAMEIAEIPGFRLYPGSWSEWIGDPTRPVATGDN